MNLPPVISGLLAVSFAVAMGLLPAGYLLARRLRGVDIRRLSPHNLGLRTVAEAVSGPMLLAAGLLDVAKGAVAVVAPRSFLPGTSPSVLAATAAAVVLGHAVSPSLVYVPPSGARVKGMSVGFGAAVGLAALGEIPWAAVTVAVLVAAVAVGVPWLVRRQWGYLSLANVLATGSLPLALWLTGARAPYLLAATAFALAVIWGHKEHLARIADGVEPRLGEQLPLAGQGGEVACAFLIHPMTVADAWEARRFRWLLPLYRRGLIPERAFRWAARFVRPMKVDDWHPIVTADGRRARVYLVGTPLLPDQIRAEPALAVRRAVQASKLAANLGVTVLGLGAYWSIVGNKGLDVQVQSPIAITNGGAYTAGTIKLAVPLVLERLRAAGTDPTRATVAVVGANGVVGFGICRAVLEHVGRLIMVGTNQERLDRSRDLLVRRYPAAAIEATTRLERLREAEVIFTATSEPRPVIFPEHVRDRCLIYDLGRPVDVDASVHAIPGVEVIPGGLVRLPGDPRGRIEDLGYGARLVPACLAETIILALDGAYERASLGDRTKAENVEYFIDRATVLGFEVITGGVV